MRPKILNRDEIESRASEISWKYSGVNLFKKYTFMKYLEGINFVTIIGELAERLDHHPTLTIGYCYVEVFLSTHEPEGITELDFQLAKMIEDSYKAE